MAKTSPFVFGDLVRTIDGCGPVMMVTDASPSHQPACTILCQCWVIDGLREIAIHAGLLESCEARPLRATPKPLFERLSPLLTMLVEAVDLWAAVESGRSEVVKVQEDESDSSVGSEVDEASKVGLSEERDMWREVFGKKTPLEVFSEHAGERPEHVVAMFLSLVRSSEPEKRACFLEDLGLLLDFALRCGHSLDRSLAAAAFNRLLDSRSGVGHT